MVSIQDFDKALADFRLGKVVEFSPLNLNEKNRGKSFEIYIKNEVIYFKRKNTYKPLKMSKFRKVIELLLKKRKLLTTDAEYKEIISDGCVRTFIFQFLKYYNLAKISGRPYCALV